MTGKLLLLRNTVRSSTVSSLIYVRFFLSLPLYSMRCQFWCLLFSFFGEYTFWHLRAQYITYEVSLFLSWCVFYFCGLCLKRMMAIAKSVMVSTLEKLQGQLEKVYNICKSTDKRGDRICKNTHCKGILIMVKSVRTFTSTK